MARLGHGTEQWAGISSSGGEPLLHGLCGTVVDVSDPLLVAFTSDDQRSALGVVIRDR